jgi:phosphatidate cytidylyltransferase
MKRLLTALVGSPVVIAAIFLLPDWGFLLFLTVGIMGAAHEMGRIARHWIPDAPLYVLPVAVPLLAAVFSFLPLHLASVPAETRQLAVFVVLAVLALGGALLVLVSRVPMEQSMPAVGILTFGAIHLAVPVAALIFIQREDPWLVILTLLVVWVGDAAAYYVGRRLGRHKMSPVVSPNKSWEGAVASFVTALVMTVGWSLYRLGGVEPMLLGVAAATSVAAQMGDLVESMFKRGAHIKDSGQSLPGHGGWYDRLDALLFGAPVMLLGLWLLDLPR